MNTNTRQPIAYAAANRPRFVRELIDFVRVPSVSAQPGHAQDVRAAAQWLASELRRIGLEDVRVCPTARHPIVYAQWLHAANRPTIIIYGHYDVQPAEPLTAWRSPPFAPVVRGSNLYGRGACDDKGQLYAHVKALEAYLQTLGRLPVNVKCIFEGEEEIGSPNLKQFIMRNRTALSATGAVISDTRMLGPNRPALIYALRGGLALELEVRGPAGDLHSGTFGGAIHNPLQATCEMIAALHDRHGRVAIPHFYDQVRTWSAAERAAMAESGPTDDEIRLSARLPHRLRTLGERGFSQYERTTIRPALTINGLDGGYRGTGGKAVIPTVARAKLSFRLVPDQEPDTIERQFRAYLAAIAPPTVDVDVSVQSRSQPALIDQRSAVVAAAVTALRRGFDAEPVFVRSGGGIPVVNTFREVLGIPTALMGFALPDDRIHAPNEKFYMPNFYRGINACIWLLAALADKQAGSPTAAFACGVDDHVRFGGAVVDYIIR